MVGAWRLVRSVLGGLGGPFGGAGVCQTVAEGPTSLWWGWQTGVRGMVDSLQTVGAISGSDTHVPHRGELALWGSVLSPGVGTAAAAALSGGLGMDSSVCDACPPRPTLDTGLLLTVLLAGLGAAVGLLSSPWF